MKNQFDNLFPFRLENLTKYVSSILILAKLE